MKENQTHSTSLCSALDSMRSGPRLLGLHGFQKVLETFEGLLGEVLGDSCQPWINLNHG